ERRRWIGEQRFLHALSYCMLLPGPEAQQLATYIGWLLHRTLGGVIAGTCFVLPSVVVLLALSYVYAAYGTVAGVAGILSGFKPVVVAIVVEAVVRISRRALGRPGHVVVAGAAFVAIFALHVPFPLIVLGAGLIGLAGAGWAPRQFAPPAGAPRAAAAGDSRSPAAVAADAPLPEHTRPSAPRALRTAAVGVVLWLLPFLAVIGWRAWSSLHAQEYRFFTLAAFVTFGGAYAVLAYVIQVATTSLGWLNHA